MRTTFLFLSIVAALAFATAPARAQYPLLSSSAFEFAKPTTLTSGSGLVTSGSFANQENLRVGLLEINSTITSGTMTFAVLQSGTAIAFSAAPASDAFAGVSGTSLSISSTGGGNISIPINLSALNEFLEVTATASTGGTSQWDASLIYVPQNH